MDAAGRSRGRRGAVASTPRRAGGRFDFFDIQGTGDDFTINLRDRYLACDRNPFQHKGFRAAEFSTDRANASRFEVVETIRRNGREYHTLPGYVYIRHRATGHFLKIHAARHFGLLHAKTLAEFRRQRNNESHGFRLWREDFGSDADYESDYVSLIPDSDY